MKLQIPGPRSQADAIPFSLWASDRTRRPTPIQFSEPRLSRDPNEPLPFLAERVFEIRSLELGAFPPRRSAARNPHTP